MAAKNRWITVKFHQHGGHVGFVAGRVPWRPVYYAEERVAEFLEGQLEAPGARSAVS